MELARLVFRERRGCQPNQECGRSDRKSEASDYSNSLLLRVVRPTFFASDEVAHQRRGKGKKKDPKYQEDEENC